MCARSTTVVLSALTEEFPPTSNVTNNVTSVTIPTSFFTQVPLSFTDTYSPAEVASPMTQSWMTIQDYGKGVRNTTVYLVIISIPQYQPRAQGVSLNVTKLLYCLIAPR